MNWVLGGVLTSVQSLMSDETKPVAVKAELPRVLGEVHAVLKPDGVLFTSNPRGNNEEGWNHGRYGVYHDLESWRTFLARAGFAELEHYYRPPGLPREQQPWLASVWRRADVSVEEK